ncbi:MAG TPA: hypothetical protein VKX45_05035 [Bryobacteraceae bacterium]|jgi:hypothetical protein|nr:hypothetical protein [Bryobacteraceae bacterium]
MTDRAFLFLFSLVMTLAGLAGMVWLIGTGQAATFDGLFLFCCCGVNSFAFGLYLRWLIRSALPDGQAHLKSGRVDAAGRRVAGGVEASAVAQNTR